MMHGMPLSGWVDHGFYSFNATFYWDLAAANGYEIDLALYTELNPLKLVRLRIRKTCWPWPRTRRSGPTPSST